MPRDISHSISVRREGDHVLIEDKEIEHGRASLLRITFLDGAAAVDIGREMVRLGIEAAREGIGREIQMDAAPMPMMKALDLAPHTDPYPEDRVEASREGTK